ILYLLDALTVEAAAIVTIGTALVASIPLLRIIPKLRPLQFDRALAKASIPFGFKAWLGGLGNLVNVRLDQVLMTRMVAPSELGLYVVAVNMSAFFVNPLISALTV